MDDIKGTAGSGSAVEQEVRGQGQVVGRADGGGQTAQPSGQGAVSHPLDVKKKLCSLTFLYYYNSKKKSFLRK